MVNSVLLYEIILAYVVRESRWLEYSLPYIYTEHFQYK